MKPKLSVIVALVWMAWALPESALAIGYKPSAVTFVQEGTQRIYVFARGDNGHLVVNYRNGASWQWSDRGLPAGAFVHRRSKRDHVCRWRRPAQDLRVRDDQYGWPGRTFLGWVSVAVG